MARALKRFAVHFAVALVIWPLAASLANPENVEYNPVSRSVIEARLQRYPGHDRQREAALMSMFKESGCDGGNLKEQQVSGRKLPNVVCLLPGGSEKTIIVGAHYDHVLDGDGVVDNWSGASLLPSLYEAIRMKPRRHRYVFIGFMGEESGELGSRFYVQQMSKENVAATEAMVNLDTLGLGQTQIWESHADKRLTNVLLYVAKKLNAPIGATNVDYVGSSDSVQFAERKIPSITIHSLTQEAWNQGILHTSKDKISAIRMDDYYQTYRVVAGYLALLDQVEGLKPAAH